jgi:hypothetical protein
MGSLGAETPEDWVRLAAVLRRLLRSDLPPFTRIEVAEEALTRALASSDTFDMEAVIAFVKHEMDEGEDGDDE